MANKKLNIKKAIKRPGSVTKKVNKKENGGAGNPALSVGLGAAGNIASGLSPKQNSFGNIAGDALSGASSGAMFGPWGAVIGAGVGIGKGLIEANVEKKKKKKFDEIKSRADFENSLNQQALFEQNFTTQGTDTGFNRGSSFGNSYLAPQQMMKTGGKKLPGGKEIDLPNGGKKYLGNKHGQSGRGSKSGILVDPKTEVTHNETKDKIVDNKGKAMEYFFSPEMKIGGKSFAKRHEEILKSGGTKANIQKELQRLAKLQEDHANKHHGEKHRDSKQILETGGAKKYNNGGPNQNFDLNTLQKDQASALKTVPTGQSVDMSGVFGGLTQEQIQETMNKNLWYDWSDFNPSNPDNVIDFQREFNALSPSIKLKEDGKFGQQTQSAYIPIAETNATQNQNLTPEQQAAEKTAEGAEKLAENTSTGDAAVGEKQKTNVPQLEPPKLRDVPPLAYLGMAAQAVGPIAALLKDSPKARKVNANLQGKEKLNRFDFNAERAQNLGNTVAFTRAIEGSGAGPAGIISMMAANNKANENALTVANKEAQVNKSQADAEKALNQRITQSNISNQYDANIRNTAAEAQRDMYEYEKDLSAVDALGNLAASGARDVLAYKRDERVAGANQIAGEYTRQRYFEKLNSSPKYRKLTKGMTDQEKRRIAAAMYDNNQTLEEMDEAVVQYYSNSSKKEKEEKRTGGYTSKYGKIKKRK